MIAALYAERHNRLWGVVPTVSSPSEPAPILALRANRINLHGQYDHPVSQDSTPRWRAGCQSSAVSPKRNQDLDCDVPAVAHAARSLSVKLSVVVSVDACFNLLDGFAKLCVLHEATCMRRKSGNVRPITAVPQMRAHHTLRAVEEGLLHGNDQGELRSLAMHHHLFAQAAITNDRGAPTHSQCLALARNEEQEADMRVLQHIAKCVGPTIPRTIRDSKRTVIEDVDEARRIAFR